MKSTINPSPEEQQIFPGFTIRNSQAVDTVYASIIVKQEFFTWASKMIFWKMHKRFEIT